jgi:hypothetical protein
MRRHSAKVIHTRVGDGCREDGSAARDPLA